MYGEVGLGPWQSIQSDWGNPITLGYRSATMEVDPYWIIEAIGELAGPTRELIRTDLSGWSRSQFAASS